MNNRRRRVEHHNTYINIAPLVEVMLVLIIIFMITAPMLNVGVRVDLPKTKAATLDDSQSKPIIVSIDKESNVYVDDAGTTIEGLGRELPAMLQERKSDTVYVRGDKDLPYGEIMRIMGAISSLGVCKVSLVAEAATANDDRIEKHVEPIPPSSPAVTAPSNPPQPKQPSKAVKRSAKKVIKRR
ncbi:MAG: ExbD/TolR family protein [Holosporales bacterium]|jgi:biopolymer transport protein TolR|nr:ExbD/TolR family protein [Holosporales bacterium]